MDAWEYLPGTTGDAYSRMCKGTGDTWNRLAGDTGDAWTRLIATCGGAIVQFKEIFTQVSRITVNMLQRSKLWKS